MREDSTDNMEGSGGGSSPMIGSGPDGSSENFELLFLIVKVRPEMFVIEVKFLNISIFSI